MFRSRAIAEERWRELQRNFREELSARSLLVERQDVGGRAGYRALIRGFRSRNEALAFCARMRRQGWDCIARL